MPGKKKTEKIETLKQLAEAAGVSMASVSLVLNNKWEKKVKPAIAEKILKLTEKHNFLLNPVGKGLTMKKSYRIALVIEGEMSAHPVLGSYSFHEVVSTIASNINNAGYALDFIQVDTESFEQIVKTKKLPGLNDGYIFIGWQENHIKKLLKAVNLKKPYIVFDNNLNDSYFSYVCKDFVSQSEKASCHLKSNNHKVIGILRAEYNPDRFELKLKGFKKGLKNTNIKLKQINVATQNSPAPMYSSYQATMDLFADKERPTAVFCTDNSCAMGVLWALDKLGYKVPEDVELISYGDEGLAVQVASSLTYIKIPSKKMSEFCTGKIIEWADGVKKFKPIQKCFKEELVLGKTTRN
ncbi:MAG: LacI family DNA-binding transcriptional regulator [Planctomycetota bacterium]